MCLHFNCKQNKVLSGIFMMLLVASLWGLLGLRLAMPRLVATGFHFKNYRDRVNCRDWNLIVVDARLHRGNLHSSLVDGISGTEDCRVLRWLVPNTIQLRENSSIGGSTWWQHAQPRDLPPRKILACAIHLVWKLTSLQGIHFHGTPVICSIKTALPHNSWVAYRLGGDGDFLDVLLLSSVSAAEHWDSLGRASAGMWWSILQICSSCNHKTWEGYRHSSAFLWRK